MQTLTIALGKAGINYLVDNYLGNSVISGLQSVVPPGKTLPVKSFDTQYTDYWDFTVALTQGQMVSFAPAITSLSQGDAGSFLLTITAPQFSATYTWNENYKWQPNGSIGPSESGAGGPWSYAPSFASLQVQAPVQVSYSDGRYDLTISATTTTLGKESANIPSLSALNVASGCFSSHVDSVVATALEQIGLSSLFNAASSNLSSYFSATRNLYSGSDGNIQYFFTLATGTGENGITYPGNDGVAIGVTGDIAYTPKGGAETLYSSVVPPPSPLVVPPPPPDSDAHHAMAYVSAYEVNGLYWAFYTAGLLESTITPNQLAPDQAALYVNSYSTNISWLDPYSQDVMNATVGPLAAPTVSFQTVYAFNSVTDAVLQTKLPTSVFTIFSHHRVASSNYLTKSALDNALTEIGISSSYFSAIESAGLATGAVVNHQLQFQVTIMDSEKTLPYITFDVTRTDVLSNLGLGLTDDVQTLTFDFNEVSSKATYVSSNISGASPSSSGGFSNFLWTNAIKPKYDDLLSQMGTTGVALPMMKGFGLVMSDSELTIQTGYVSILTKLESL